MNTETWTSTAGRTYEVKRDEQTPARVRESLISRGLDGFCYNAESVPTGRQKKVKYAILYKSQKGLFSYVYGF